MNTLTPALPRDPEVLAYALKSRGLPGARSKTAIRKLRTERAKRNAPVPVPAPLADRLRARLAARYRAEIRRRGGETEIVGQFQTVTVDIADRHVRSGLVLMHAEGWRKYGGHSNRYVHLSYLCGMDNGHPWAVRVAGSIETVWTALAWVTPVAVKEAEAAGRRVWRQGDVYVIETTATRNQRGVTDLPASHQWNPATGYLTHHPDDGRRHRPVRVGRRTYVEFVMQRVYEMGRSGARANGD